MTSRSSFSFAAALWLALVPSAATAGGRVQLTLDASEAEQVLAILALHRAGKPVPDPEWQKLFTAEPYRRLKDREAKIAERFHDPSIIRSDEQFRQFVLSDEIRVRAPKLERALALWNKADLYAVADRILPYLPPSALVRARVYPMIKPGSNSFVWEASTNPAIFLYLDPDVSREKFENTVAHELHHIGLESALADYGRRLSSLPERTRAVADSIAAFGEGLAMLAAAGGPDADPQAASSLKERARWSHDLANFSGDLQAVNAFFLDVLHGKFTSPDAIEEKASSFYGLQGPWYTVGYRMAVMVEKRYGRAALIETMLDPRLLLVRYNRVAAEEGAKGGAQLPLWSEEVLKQVQAPAE